METLLGDPTELTQLMSGSGPEKVSGSKCAAQAESLSRRRAATCSSRAAMPPPAEKAIEIEKMEEQKLKSKFPGEEDTLHCLSGLSAQGFRNRL